MANTLSRTLTEQLSEPQSRQDRHLETLIQVSRAIGSILDVQELMVRIMEQATRAFEADRSTLYIFDEQTGELWTRIAQGLEHWSRELRIRADQGLAGRVFRTHESMCITDTYQTPGFARRTAESTGYVPRSMLIVPVAHRPGKCEGVLQVMDRRVGYFAASDLPLLEAIAVQVGISLDNARLYEAQKRQFASFVRAFSAALDKRDPLTAIHSVNVANYAMGIAHQLGRDRREVERLRVAGLLHDVGKIGVPEAILTKPGRLTAEEYAQMKEHAAHSRHILEQIEFTDDLKGLEFLAAAHHEKLDGSGYPDGLDASQIPLNSRILTVADVFDALTQKRHYREHLDIDRAMSVIDDMTPSKLDADCVAALKQFMNYQTGNASA